MSKWVRALGLATLLDPNTDKDTAIDTTGRTVTIGQQDFYETLRNLNNSLLSLSTPDLPNFWALRDRLKKAKAEKAKILEITEAEYPAISAQARTGAGLNAVGRYSLSEHLNEILNPFSTPEEALAKIKTEAEATADAAKTLS